MLPESITLDAQSRAKQTEMGYQMLIEKIAKNFLDVVHNLQIMCDGTIHLNTGKDQFDHIQDFIKKVIQHLQHSNDIKESKLNDIIAHLKLIKKLIKNVQDQAIILQQ